MALYASGTTFEIHEIRLRDKPAHMLAVSPKGTVPVLCLTDGRILQESLDIMRWALAIHDPQGWLRGADTAEACEWLTRNDGPFKAALDRYKYTPREQAADRLLAREQAMQSLIAPLTRVLSLRPYVGGSRPLLQDVAIFPFVRQFAGVDPVWFEQTVAPGVQRWLRGWLASPLFERVMRK